MTDLTLIALCGRAGSGKDTVAQHLVQRYGFVTASFAEAPRQMLEALLAVADVDHAWLFERDKKERTMPTIGLSYRQMMQTLGTEWGRGLDADLWCRVLARSLGLDIGAPVHDRICITDVRYLNEAALAHHHGGKIVGIVRPSAVPVLDHSSETEPSRIISTLAETTLLNDGSIAGLHDLVDGLADSWGLDRRSALPHGWGA